MHRVVGVCRSDETRWQAHLQGQEAGREVATRAARHGELYRAVRGRAHSQVRVIEVHTLHKEPHHVDGIDGAERVESLERSVPEAGFHGDIEVVGGALDAHDGHVGLDLGDAGHLALLHGRNRAVPAQRVKHDDVHIWQAAHGLDRRGAGITARAHEEEEPLTPPAQQVAKHLTEHRHAKVFEGECRSVPQLGDCDARAHIAALEREELNDIGAAEGRKTPRDERVELSVRNVWVVGRHEELEDGGAQLRV